METANPEQADAWNGREGNHWTQHAERYERSMGSLRKYLVTADLIDSNDRVLDIGCGTGATTRGAARLAARGSALGVDLSEPMLGLARATARDEGLTNVEYVQADAQIYAFEPNAFDVVISSLGAMFFADPVAAFTNIGNALRPDGRLALVAWRELARNEWVSAFRTALALDRQLPDPPPDAPTPFALSDPGRVRAILSSAGFENIDLKPIEASLEFGDDADDAYRFIATTGIVEGLTEDLSAGDRDRALAELRKTIEAHASGDGVRFACAAWLITARCSSGR